MSLSNKRAGEALRRGYRTFRANGRVLQQVSHDEMMGAFDATNFDDAEFTGPDAGTFDSSCFDGCWFATLPSRPTAKFDRHFFDRDTIAFS